MREIWEFEPHTYSDDGFDVKCYGGQTEVTADSPIREFSKGRGTAECSECEQRVAVVSING